MKLRLRLAQISGAFKPVFKPVFKPAVCAALVAQFVLQGCMYGFAGGGLPSHVRTVAVIPFENETATPELQREFTDLLRERLRDRLGLREAAEARANAVVRGTVRRYEIDIPIGVSADKRASTTARRQLRLVVDMEMVDQVSGKNLWVRKGVSAEAQYEERGEPAARGTAVEKIVNILIEGAQSQW
jgi:hypothetical protein